jgi:uncharacterized protein (TIGR03083 family)
MERLASADVYRWHRERLLAMAPELDDEQLATGVPACPAWTVRDLYGHLAGVAADILSGALTDIPTPEDTRRQVERASSRTLAEVCADWERDGPKVEELLRAVRGVAAPAIDVWSHDNDIRGALGLPRGDDAAVVRFVVAMLAASHRSDWGDEGLPTLRVVGSHRDWTFGEGEPVATLTGDDYELARLFIGRRSDDQLRAMDWDGDPSPFVGRLSVFDPPERALVD